MKSIQQQCVERIYELLPQKKELKFGCEVIKSEMYQGVVVGEAYEQIAYLNYGAMKVYLAPKEHFEIIGQPIRLADLLLAIDKELHNEVGIEFLSGCLSFSHKEYGYAKYNISNDNILSQSDEFCEFLWELIK